MAHEQNATPAPGEQAIYQIRLQGHLGRQSAARFAGLSIILEAAGETLLTGPVADQAALYGLLRTVRDLGLPLIAVARMTSVQASTNASLQDEKETRIQQC